MDAKKKAENGRYNILVVDDQASVRRVVRKWLENAGYKVDEAKNGREGIEKIQSGSKYSLIVTDLNMPEVDGVEFLCAIDNGNRTPTLIHSATVGEEDIRRILIERGLQTSDTNPIIIGKPCGLKDFYAAVELLLKQANDI